MDNETLARKHCEAFDDDVSLVAAYRVDDSNCFVIARPAYSGHRLSTTVPIHKVNSKIVEYVNSVGMNFGFDNVLVKEFEVLDGKVT